MFCQCATQWVRVQVNWVTWSYSWVPVCGFSIIELTSKGTFLISVSSITYFPSVPYTLVSNHFTGPHSSVYIVTCQAHPVLVKKVNQRCGSFLFKIFAWVTVPGPVSCRCPGGLLETPPRWHATICAIILQNLGNVGNPIQIELVECLHDNTCISSILYAQWGDIHFGVVN